MGEYDFYPKQLRSKRIAVKPKSCFMIMPFSDEFDEMYGEIKEVLAEDGYTCSRCDDWLGSSPITSDVLEGIVSSQFVIADLTERNANVYYELGIAHVFKDPTNVFLIVQKGAKVPGDIKHLRYFEYSPDNLKKLTAGVRKFVRSNEKASEFRNALNISGVIDYVAGDGEPFIGMLETAMGDDVSMITSLLMGDTKPVNEHDAERILNRCEAAIRQVLRESDEDTQNGLFRLYCVILLSMKQYAFASAHVSFFLEAFLLEEHVDENTVLERQTSLAEYLASRGAYLPETLPWIIAYFERSKSTSIDLNRYKLEALLTTTQSPVIEDALIDALMSPNDYVREHLSDIIGERKLIRATPMLESRLAAENNIYSATSMMAALGKIGGDSSGNAILGWLHTHDSLFQDADKSFILNHARIALTRIRDRLGTDESVAHVSEFDALFKSIITNPDYL